MFCHETLRNVCSEVPPPGHRHVVICTSYDPHLPQNKSDPTLFDKDDQNRSQRRAWMGLLREAAGSLLAFVSYAMPEDLRSMLPDRLKMCFEHDIFVTKDSSVEGDVGYDSVHLAYYTCHVTRVCTFSYL